MDHYQSGMVYSSIDHAGRYAYGNQPRIAYWNLARFAETLLPLLALEAEAAVAAAHAALDAYPTAFERTYHAGLRAKLGLHTEQDGDIDLARDLFACMEAQRADFTLTFRYLCDAAETGAEDNLRALFADPTGLDAWLARWRARLAREASRGAGMRAVNPAFIPRNHRVQAAIAAAEHDDFSKFEELMQVLAKPFDDQAAFAQYAEPPRPEEIVHQTFCGT
jgi:uncharacterized protein YdiU (UPF0061 family)